TFEITEPLPLLVELEAIDNVSCKFGNDGRIKLNISGGKGAYTIQWSNGMTGSEITGLRAGVYTLFVIDENSCFESIAYTVTEPAEALTVTGQSSVELCLFTDVLELVINVTGGTAPYTYAWSNGATTKDLLNIAPGSYTVVVTDAKGCVTEGTYTVPPPTSPLLVELTGKFGICTDGERGEVNATVSGGVGPYRFQWSNGATTSSITNLLPGNYSLTVTDRNGCTVTEDFEIAPPLNLRISLLNITSVSCFGGNNGSINIAINGGRAPFKINWSHGLQDQTFASGLVAGVYSVTVEDALGCVTSAAYNIQEPEILNMRGTVEDSKCAGDNRGIISLNVFGGTAPYTYRWSNGANNRVLRNLGPGTYSVVVTDRAGCSTGSTFVVSEPDPLVIEGSYTEMLSCFGDRDGAININIRGGMQPYRISWSDNDQLETLNRSNLGAGTYTVRVVDDNGCVQVKTFEIEQPEELEARLFTRFDVNCETRELTGVAWVIIKGGTKDYEIFWNNGAQNVEESTFYEDGIIKVTVIDANGCMVEVEKYVEMPVAFTDADFTYTVISIGIQGEILVNDQVQFHDETFGEVIAWEWDFGDGTKSNEQNPMHTYTKPGTYTISLMTFDAMGCVSKTQIVVEVVASYRILVPNAFTPNDDGLNDTFIPKMRGIEDFEMHIFNKWGELVYSAYSQEDAGWDGRLNGRISPNGNYVYKIIFKAVDGEKGSKTGVFTLVL
uniref:T9SS type B sorting domain-containing protein n=1 Tax=Aquiflexum sp. TaxID=1872584 RepID=UPI0035939800